MPFDSPSTSGSDLFIVDNSDEHWKVRNYLADWCELSKSIDIATGYFEIGAFLALKDKWQAVDSIRILMGNEVSKRTKKAFEEGLRKISDTLDASLESEKVKNDFLSGVPAIVEALRSGKIQCRVYRKDKFHAKCYLTHARQAVIGSFGLVGSSNFTHPGLQDNVELNVQIRGNEVRLLQDWFEKHWNESEEVTAEVLQTVERHTHPRTPFEVWFKGLHELLRGHQLTPDGWDKEESKIFKKLGRYQQDAYKNLMEISRIYGGGFLCLRRRLSVRRGRFGENLCRPHADRASGRARGEAGRASRPQIGDGGCVGAFHRKVPAAPQQRLCLAHQIQPHRPPTPG